MTLFLLLLRDLLELAYSLDHSYVQLIEDLIGLFDHLNKDDLFLVSSHLALRLHELVLKYNMKNVTTCIRYVHVPENFSFSIELRS